MHWRAGRLGRGRGGWMRARSRGCGLGWTLGRQGLLGRRSRDSWLVSVLLEQVGEISHLLLQRSDLGLQGAKRLWQREELGGQRWQLAGNRRRRLLWEGSQTAMMQAGQQLQVLAASPVFAG